MTEYVINTENELPEEAVEALMTVHGIISVHELDRNLDEEEVLQSIGAWLNIPAGGSLNSIPFILNEIYGTQRPSDGTTYAYYELWVEINKK